MRVITEYAVVCLHVPMHVYIIVRLCDIDTRMQKLPEEMAGALNTVDGPLRLVPNEIQPHARSRPVSRRASGNIPRQPTGCDASTSDWHAKGTNSFCLTHSVTFSHEPVIFATPHRKAATR